MGSMVKDMPSSSTTPVRVDHSEEPADRREYFRNTVAQRPTTLVVALACAEWHVYIPAWRRVSSFNAPIHAFLA